jgi:hypothetical protein
MKQGEVVHNNLLMVVTTVMMKVVSMMTWGMIWIMMTLQMAWNSHKLRMDNSSLAIINRILTQTTRCNNLMHSVVLAQK